MSGTLTKCGGAGIAKNRVIRNLNGVCPDSRCGLHWRAPAMRTVQLARQCAAWLKTRHAVKLCVYDTVQYISWCVSCTVLTPVFLHIVSRRLFLSHLTTFPSWAVWFSIEYVILISRDVHPYRKWNWVDRNTIDKNSRGHGWRSKPNFIDQDGRVSLLPFQQLAAF